MERKEAIEVYHGLINTKIKEAFEFFAPELRESEDERIRKAIVLGIKRCADAGSIFGTVINNEGINYHDVLSYLERQKEQKPAEWSEEDRKMIDHLIEALPMWANGRIAILPSQADEYVERLKSLRPQPKRDGGDDYNKGYIKGRADTLKEFNDMPSWKPSEEQMSSLMTAVSNAKLNGNYDYAHNLETLHNDLEAL